MRRRSTAIMLAITLATLFGTSLSIGAANASSPSHGGWHVAAHGTAPVNHRTGLPAGTLPTHAQLKRAARINAAAPHTNAPTQNAGVSYHLTYNGGPVVSNVQVKPVLWGAGTYIPQETGSVTPNMQTFFHSITQTPYPGWLSEYNTIGTGVPGETGQRIGSGSVLASQAITPASPANGSVVDDAQIQQELFNQIVSHVLPVPTVDAQNLENTTYTLYFPQGVNICQDSALMQCSDVPPGNPTGSPVFCGYHSSFGVVNSSNQKVADVRYIVLPYPDANWQLGCSDPSSSNPAVTGLEAVASHELAEVITDPEVGEAPSFASPLGWYDGNGSNTDPGEIADICDSAQPSNHTTGVTGTDGQSYTLENIWSNRVGACGITTKPTAAKSVTASPRAGGAITVRWSAPSITGGLPLQYDVYETPAGGARALAGTTSSTTWTSPALTNGSSYSFDVVAHNTAGFADPTATASAIADATAPVVTNTNALPAFTLTGSTKISYSSADADSPTGITYDVAYKAAAWNGSWSALTTLAHSTSATSASLSLRPGTEYCLVVRARDAAGNVSGWTSPRCTAAPLDDTSLTTATSGWSRVRVTAAYRGTLTRTSKVGSRLSVTGATANRLGLVVATCPTCGNVQIYLGNSLWRTISTKSSAWHYKQLLLPSTFSTRKTAVVIRAASGQAVIDGLGVFRPAPTF